MTTTTPHNGGTPHTHGQRATYLHHGCRCPLCRHAQAAYVASRTRLIAYGRWQANVDAEPARQHVRALAAAGITERQIATRAGITHPVIRNLIHGAAGRTPSKKLRRENADRILAIPLPTTIDPTGTRRVDATGTRRRLQALTAAGWPLSNLARRCGILRRHLFDILHGHVHAVTPRTEATIRRLYDRTWNQQPTPDQRVRPVDADTARAIAARHRWAPALAWDDDHIDDPQAVPDWTGRCGEPGGYYDHGQIGTATCPRCRNAVSAAARGRKLRRRARQDAA